MTQILDVSPTVANTTFKNGAAQSVTGRMLALASSADGQTVFVGSYSNLWVSQDGGQTWKQVAFPQPPSRQFGVPGAMGGWCVMDVAVSPNDAQRVLAILRNDRVKSPGDRGIWRSVDGGSSWSLVHQFPLGEAVGQLVWPSGNGRLVLAAGGSSLAISHDGGATFQDILRERINHVATGSEFFGARTIYALGNDAIFVSFDEGANWKQDLGPIPRHIGGTVGFDNSQAPSVLVVEAGDPRLVYVVANANGGTTLGPPAVSGPFVSVYKDQQHFAYQDSAGTIWDAFWNSNSWTLQQLTGADGKTIGTAAAPGSGRFVSVYKDQQHFAYQDSAGTIWDAFWNSNNWTLQQINAGGKTAGPATAPGGGPFVSVYKDQQHFAYQDSAGTIWDAFWNSNNWTLQQINAGGKTGGPAAAPGGGPFVSVYKDQQHFAYQDSAGTIWDAFWNSNNWSLQQLTGTGGKTAGPAAAPGGGPFVSVYKDQQHFAYHDSAGTIWDAFWNGNNWTLQQINSGGKTAGPAAAPGGGPFVSVYKDQQHFAYQDSAGTIWDAFWNSNNWALQQLTGTGGKTAGSAATPGGGPFVSVYKDQQHFVYQDGAGTIWDAFWNSNDWTLQQINQGPMLWQGDYSQFEMTGRSVWNASVLPNLGDQDSGNVFLATTRFEHGNVLFYGAQRSKAYVGALNALSAPNWRELDDDGTVHPDLHGIFLSPNFEAWIDPFTGNYQFSGVTSGTKAAAAPFLSVYHDQQHFTYQDSAGTIWDAFWDGNQWNLQQINAGGKTGGPAAALGGGLFVSVYKDQQHFAYQDSAGVIWDAFWNSNSWTLQQLTGAGGKTAGPAAAPGCGPFASVYKDQQHFAYQDSAGVIWDTFWNSNSWTLQQLTGAGGKTAGPAGVPGGGPFVSVYKDQQHFAYQDSAGVIWDVFWNSNNWSLQQLTGTGGKTAGPAAVLGGGPSVSVYKDQQHFAYQDGAGVIWDAFWNSNNWALQQLTGAGGKTAGSAAAPGGGPFVSVYKDQQHFAYQDSAGIIWDAFWNSNNWTLQQITGLGGKITGFNTGPRATPGGGPFVSVYKDQQHFAYLDSAGVIWDAFWNSNEWTLQQINASGTIWLLSDGGVHRSTDGGKHFQPARNLNSLSSVNLAGAAIEGKGPVLSLNTGDNDGFFSANGGMEWASQDYGGGDNDCSFADPLRPNSMLVFTPRWDSHANFVGSKGQTITVYETAPGRLPNAAAGTNEFHTIPGPPPNTDGGARWTAGSGFVIRGFRPLVLNLPSDDPSAPGDYVFIRFKSNAEAVLLRTRSILKIQHASDWDTTATSANQGKLVFQQGPSLPPGCQIVQASGGHSDTVFYVGNAANELFKWTDGMSDWQQLVPGGGAQSALRFFVDPYRPGRVYLLDALASHIMRSEDGGDTWHVDSSLEVQLSCGHTIPLNRSESIDGQDHLDVVLSDMQFHPPDPLARFAVGFAGAFHTADGSNWVRLLDTAALSGRPVNCYFDSISKPAEPALYVAFDGRSVVKVTDL